MPKVPQLDGQQIQQNPLTNIRVDESVNREAFNVGQSKQKLDNTIYDIAEKAKKSADQVSVLEAENELTKFENDFQYNPETGMYRKEGKDAFGLIELSKEQYGKKVGEISGKILKNDVQRSMFNEKASVRQLQFEKNVMGHVGAQIKKYDDETTKAGLELEQSNAVNGYQDPDQIALSLANQKRISLEYSDRHGEPLEMATLRAKSSESKTHAKIIDRIVANGDDIAAEDYYKKNEANMMDDEKTQVIKLLEISSTKGKSQRFTDDVMKRGLSQSAALKEAAGIENPKLREATEARIDRMFNLKKEAEKEYQENIYSAAVKQINETGSMDGISEKLIANMKPETINAVKSYMDRNPVRDNGEIYYKLRSMAENKATRQAFIGHDFLKEKPNLSKEHFEELIKLRDDLKSGKKDAEKKLDGFLSDSQLVEDQFRQATGENADEKNEAYLKYRTAVDQEAERIKREQDRPFLSNEELRNISKNYLTEMIVKEGMIWDTKKRKFDIEVDDIPEADAQKIKKRLIETGRPATDENVKKYFILSKEKQQGK